MLLEQIHLDHKRQVGLGSCKAKVGENVPKREAVLMPQLFLEQQEFRFALAHLSVTRVR